MAIKRREWGALKGKERANLKTALVWFPVVIGPRQRDCIVDHHHFGLALHEESVKAVWWMERKDLSWLKPRQFWGTMERALLRKAFERAIEAAIKLAYNQDARYLQDWAGIIKTT